MKIDLFSCLGQSSFETHKLQPFERLFGYAMNNWIYNHNVIGDLTIIDPFARKCSWGTLRNDINPEFYPDHTTHRMDALEFMLNIPRETAHIVLFDPPFSDRQSNEEYGTSNLYTNPKYITDICKQAFNVLKPGGYFVKCGYNTNSPGAGFELIHVSIANFGACRNDILFSLWKKTQTSLKVGLN